jgi:hypothetical protein
MDEFSLSNFLALFSYEKKESRETFEEVFIKLSTDTFKELNASAFNRSLQFINPRDKLNLSFIVGENDPVDYYSEGDADEFVSEVQRKLSNRDDEEIEIIITINKTISKGVLSIYYYEAFLDFLDQCNLAGLLYTFSRGVKNQQFLICEFQTDEKFTVTSSIGFVNKGGFGTPPLIERVSKIDKAKSVCYNNFLNEYVLIPEDFFIHNSDCERMKRIFNLLAVVSSIVFLYDISNITDNILEYRLNGYKSITAKIDFFEIKPEQADQYSKIYKWVYDSGNFIDKIGLARNIISLHLENIKLCELKGDPFQSIQSSYKIYEKQNIKQYIEVRNKISDQLLGFYDRANKVTETFAAGFQKSAMALITFFISAIALKLLNKDKLIEVFTFDASILSSVFIGCSVIYFCIARWEVKFQQERFSKNYQNLKSRYSDLLDSNDIQRILNNDCEFNDDLDFIKSKAKKYTIMWILFLCILLITTWGLYFFYNTSFFNSSCS